MLTQTESGQSASGLDTGIKVLTIIKLLLQVAFYGLLIGGTVWLMVANPLPQIIQVIQEQVIKSVVAK